MPPHFLCSCRQFSQTVAAVSDRHLIWLQNQINHTATYIFLTKYKIPIIFCNVCFRGNRVRPFVCNAYDCTQCVQGSIHNYNHIKTYVIKQNISSRRAADDRPYGFTFINYYLNEKILPLPVVEPILQSVRLAFTERRYNFPLSILHFQFKKNLPNTANAIFGRIFYLFTYSLCASFSQNYSASGRLASFSR